MTSPAQKRRRLNASIVNDNDENDGNFIDLFTNNDGTLSDTELEYDDMNREDDGDQDAVEESDLESDEDENVREVRSKQKFYNIEDVVDPKNYQSLPDQQDKTFVWKARDKNDPTTYKWETKVNHQGRVASSNLLRNQPGPSRIVKQCTSLHKLFDLYITDEMIRDVSEYTNVKINNILVENPQWTYSCKYPHIKVTTPDEVRSFFGLIYICVVLRQNLLSVKRVYQHQYSNPLFKETMSQNRFEFLTRILQFDEVETRTKRWENDHFAAFRSFFNQFNEHVTYSI